MRYTVQQFKTGLRADLMKQWGFFADKDQGHCSENRWQPCSVFKRLLQSRADNSYERELVKLLNPELLIIDDFGLQKLTDDQAGDFYEAVIERHGRASLVITSNRDVQEWMALFDDPIMANSALDRIAHNAHKLVIEGESYRREKDPLRKRKA